MLLFLLLPTVGCVWGICLYPTMQSQWTALLPITPIDGGFRAVFSQWITSCFQPLCLMLLLFVAGLSAFGTPIVLAVPVFWGLGLGLCEAWYMQRGISGLPVVALVLLPHAVMELVAVLMASSEALRMTFLVASQLLPHSSRGGGLFDDFRLYGMRFLLLIALICGAGALDVLLRLLLRGLL